MLIRSQALAERGQTVEEFLVSALVRLRDRERRVQGYDELMTRLSYAKLIDTTRPTRRMSGAKQGFFWAIGNRKRKLPV